MAQQNIFNNVKKQDKIKTIGRQEEGGQDSLWQH